MTSDIFESTSRPIQDKLTKSQAEMVVSTHGGPATTSRRDRPEQCIDWPTGPLPQLWVHRDVAVTRSDDALRVMQAKPAVNSSIWRNQQMIKIVGLACSP